MAELQVDFGHWIYGRKREMPWIHQPNGPLFTHWLPDGEKDAIQLRTDDPDATLTVWFERYGHKPEGKFIVFDKEKREADLETIARQAVLDAGPLSGKLRLQNIPDETIDVLRRGDMTDARYQKLAKRIVKIVPDSINPFLILLRINYGQFWLREVDAWDSREITVGMFCRRWGMRWSTDGTTWQPLKPDEENTVRSHVIGFGGEPPFHELLTQADWEHLKTAVLNPYTPSVAGYLLNRCRSLLSRGELRYALVEGMSALEIALDEYVSRKCDGPLKNQVFNDKFGNMHAVGKMALVAYMVPGMVPGDIEETAKAIECRNKLVHEGTDPPRDCYSWLDAAIRVTGRVA